MTETLSHLTREGAKLSRVLSPDTVILVNSGATLGVAKILNIRCCANDGIAALVEQRSGDKEFLCHYINTQTSRLREVVATGNGQPNLNTSLIRQMHVPLPSAREQRAIAEVLLDVDGLLGALEVLIAKKRAIKQAAMQQLLTGRTRLPGFSGEWPDSRLDRFLRDVIVPMRDKPKRLTGDVPWCRIEDFDGVYLRESKSGQNVDAQTIQEMNLRVYPVGTLLVSCSADLGRCAIVARPLVSNQTFIGLVFDDEVSNSLFFYYYMTFLASQLNALSSGTTISYLSRKQFEGFAVSVPSDPDEQAAISIILFDMDEEISALEARRDITRAIKQGMMQQLFTGRVRLVKPSPAEAGI